MRIEATLLGAGVALGLAVLLLSGSGEEEWRGRVVLNPDRPDAPHWGLDWDMGTLPKPQAEASIERPASQTEAPLDDGIPADPGIWATTAEFAEPD